MPKSLNSYWFPNFATKYKFYFESGIIPQPFIKKFWKIFHKVKKFEAVKEGGEGENDVIDEKEALEFIEKMEAFMKTIGKKPKEEKIQSYFYKDPSSMCEVSVKPVKTYENKVEIRMM